jgi:hypothetical protein
MNKRKYLVLGLNLAIAGLLSGLETLNAQIVINEIQVTNLSTIQDEDGDYEDWFELYNAGMTSVNLSEYSVSDRLDNTENWILPDVSFNPGQHLLVFASGKNRIGDSIIIDHLELPVYPWNWWTYLAPTSQPASNWNEVGFDDSSWGAGTGGIGFGDGDDGTEIQVGILSLYCRTTFNLNDPDDVGFMLLNVDYDDAFVCYLNGVEIARANIGTAGVDPTFNTPADGGHEALGYQGMETENFIIDYNLFSDLLLDGENVIGLQVHNADVTSSDLTGNVYVLLGMGSPDVQTELAPEWIVYNSPLNHASFGLSAGETLYLKNAIGEVVDSRIINQMSSDHSLKRSDDGDVFWCLTDQPTPDQENDGNCFSAYEPLPEFSVESGVYGAPVFLTITCPDAEAQIYVTFDGSVPDENDLLYTAGFPVSASAVVSARAYGVNALPSPVVKNTYIINESEIDLPIMAISTDPANLWDPVTGIHVFGPPDYDPNVPYFGANFWEDWEREAYMEYFDENHVIKTEGPVGVKIHGGWSRSAEQKSLRIQAKGKYGMETMDYPFIADKPFIESFKGFNLRNGGNSYGEYRFHEALIERTTRNTHVDYMAYTPVIVFLNGEYWGFMEVRENLDQHYIANNHDIGSSDATVVSANYLGFNVINGDPTSFYNLHEYATQNDPNSPGYFENISIMLDVENYADYIIAQTYWANGDWSNGWQNNTKLWHDDRPGGKWRFLLMDMDFGMGLAGASPYDNYINTAGDEGYLTDQLFGAFIQNDEFRNYFINRYADLINTEFQIERISNLAYEMRDQIIPVFQRHTQRWGTDGNALNSTLEARLDWAEERVQGGREVVQNHFGMSSQVDITLDVIPAGAGRIHISTIEPDETEYPWTGVYFNGNPVRITVYENPGYSFSHWQANEIFGSNNSTREHFLNFGQDTHFTAVFTGTNSENAISITELMFDPDSQNSSGDWIEIHNSAQVPVNISNWKIKDSNHFNVFSFGENTFIEPGEFVVVASDVVAFEAAYPSVTNVVGSLNFSLGNDFDEVYLQKPNGENVISFAYSKDDGHELDCSAGCGHSRGHLVGGDDYAPQHWFLECENGSPGAEFTPCEYPIMLTEINYNSSDENDSDDWIELHNTTSDGLDLSNWKFRDGNDNLYVIPSGTTLEAGEYLVLARSTENFSSAYPVTENYIGSTEISLGNDGDRIKIYDAENQLRISMQYKANSPWNYLANGLGYTLEFTESSNEPCLYNNWFAGCEGGSPARSYDAACAPLVSVNNVKATSTAAIYPNPAIGMIYLDNSNDQWNAIRIFDMHGSLILNEQLNDNSLWQFDVSSLATGIYMVQLSAENEHDVIRLVVE